MTNVGKPVGAPINGAQKARDRITAEKLSAMAKRLGRCGDIHPLTGHVCVTQPHDDDVEHMAVQIGGPRDGHVYASWGGHKQNTDTGLTHYTRGRRWGKSPLIVSPRQAGKTTAYNEAKERHG